MNQKKNSKILIISIILTIILIIGIGVVYIILATDMFKSEKKLFFKYITQVGDSKKGFISEEVTKYFEKQKSTQYKDNGTISFKITSYDNQGEFDNINKCNIDFSGKVDMANSKSEQDININYSNDVKFPISYKQSGNKLGLQTQYVGNKFIAVETDKLNKLSNSTFNVSGMSVPESNEKAEISSEQLKNIQETYFGILNQELQDGNFVKIIEDNVTGYKLTLNGEELKNVLVKLMETLKNDQTTLDTINGYIKSKGLDEIKVKKIESVIKELENNSDINNEKFEMTVYIQNKKVSKLVISLNEAEITIEKNENANTKQYNISSEIHQDNKKTRIYLNSSFSGLQSLQSITESWELGIQTSDDREYIYYFNNNIDFEENSEIEDFTSDNSLTLTDLEEEQSSNLINAIIERITKVNSQQMEKLGLTESENPLIKAIPAIDIYTQSMSSIDNAASDLDQNTIESHNTKFENYESLDAKGTTVKGLITTIQSNNKTNEEEKYLQISEINFNGDEYEATDENILLIKSEISLDDTYKVEFERNENTGLIYRAVINKN